MTELVPRGEFFRQTAHRTEVQSSAKRFFRGCVSMRSKYSVPPRDFIMIQATIKSLSTQHIDQPNSYSSWKKGAAAKQVRGLLLQGKKWKCYTEVHRGLLSFCERGRRWARVTNCQNFFVSRKVMLYCCRLWVLVSVSDRGREERERGRHFMISLAKISDECVMLPRGFQWCNIAGSV